MQDYSLFKFGEIGNQEIFDIKYIRPLHRHFSDRLNWLAVRMVVNDNTELIYHSVYSNVDFLRDLGGLAFILVLMATLCTSLFTFNKLENILVG